MVLHHIGYIFPRYIRGRYAGPGGAASAEMYQIDWYERNPMMSFEELRGLYHIADRRAEEGPEPRSEGQGILHTPDSFGDT